MAPGNWSLPGYSGNTHFMTQQNNYFVDDAMTTREEDRGPCPRGSHLPAPALEHARVLMRRVFDDAREVAQRGRLDVSRDLSQATVGARLKAGLEVIGGIA